MTTPGGPRGGGRYPESQPESQAWCYSQPAESQRLGGPAALPALPDWAGCVCVCRRARPHYARRGALPPSRARLRAGRPTGRRLRERQWLRRRARGAAAVSAAAVSNAGARAQGHHARARRPAGALPAGPLAEPAGQHAAAGCVRARTARRAQAPAPRAQPLLARAMPPTSARHARSRARTAPRSRRATRLGGAGGVGRPPGGALGLARRTGVALHS